MMRTGSRAVPGGLLLVLLLLVPPAAPASATPEVRVSLVTMFPGDRLFTGFGHIALRLRRADADISVDYGTYDTSDPLMGWNFLVGKLDYYCSRTRFDDMISWYRDDFGGIIEQELALSPAEVRRLLHRIVADLALLSPEGPVSPATLDAAVERLFTDPSVTHTTYRYHHFHNNCSTKLRDLLDEVMGGALGARTREGPAGVSLRDLINASLHPPRFAATRWLVYGLLNGEIDQPATRWEQMFLPWFLAEELRGLATEAGPRVTAERVLAGRHLDAPPLPSPWPGVLALALLALVFAAPGILRRGRRPLALLWIAAGLAATFYAAVLLVAWGFSPYPETRPNATVLFFHPGHLALVWGGLVLWRRPRVPWLEAWLLAGVAVSSLGVFAHLLGLLDQEILPYGLGTLVVAAAGWWSLRRLAPRGSGGAA
ncbi:MAG: DUF4105 domain-containing protein [Deltaproteobacteria bacterium]|nr:DUF4105 domain-containing protein [Deltaproteobacteria bacterium]